jgi:hypothetical protein
VVLATLGTNVTHVTDAMKNQVRPVQKKTSRRGDLEKLLLVVPQHSGYGSIHIEGPLSARSMHKTNLKRLKGGESINVEVLSGVKVMSVPAVRMAGGGKSVYAGYQVIDLPSGYPDTVRQTFFETVSLVHGLLKDVGPGQQISKPELLLKVSDLLVDEAKTEQSTKGTEEAWQAMLLKGLERKKTILNSAQFKSVGEVAEVLDVKEPAIRRRIREYRLFAVKSPGTDEYRIPVWALAVTPEQTRDIHDACGDMDAWALHHFMSTPNSWLNGLRPFELLLPAESLTSEQLARRREVAQHFGAADANSLLDVVLKALAHEATEESEA